MCQSNIFSDFIDQSSENNIQNLKLSRHISRK
jgi:hypothetical protein